ncbi:general transcription factor 3C polypeptide 6 isoform X2 [Leucoraja erinacea]|uniref:general transcription factor 3C polypeptide 6 isoform X2 n=1 Tax=Leucoraja erinaceus TaxID=7782 RepID=UPI002457779E|nr:general transcription factor 3C polypeptide 6 isoform X2 [Leucoraja erinacea]
MAAQVAGKGLSLSPRGEDGDWEEEEQLVVVELSGIIDPDFLLKCRNECKIVGIDTEQPIMQVDRCVFAGEYEDVLGTCVIFEETSEPGRIEYLKIKENDFTRRGGLICSFVPNRSSLVDAGDRVISEEGLDLMTMQDQEPNVSSGSEPEVSDLENGGTSQELNRLMDENPSGGNVSTSDAEDGVMELINQSSEEPDVK